MIMNYKIKINEMRKFFNLPVVLNKGFNFEWNSFSLLVISTCIIMTFKLVWFKYSTPVITCFENDAAKKQRYFLCVLFRL